MAASNHDGWEYHTAVTFDFAIKKSHWEIASLDFTLGMRTLDECRSK
ncbi:hypothetical protein PLANPX_5193 [Lacipirellula parvula]|uniref:Uncharacterized protein n=1 Tax=Lacipirellula parvula TaxID=2650471 RepID=A0A5K7XKB4_9BACT|nr:hypothetical protein PLANPX_5193 [Lacipirellula parvula]